MSKKLFNNREFRLQVKKLLERVHWYIAFDKGAEDLKKTIIILLKRIDEEDK